MFKAVAASVPSLHDDTVAAVVRVYAEHTDLRRMVEDTRTDTAKSLPRKRRVALHRELPKQRIGTLRWGVIALAAINSEEKSGKVRYPLDEVLLWALCAVPCGAGWAGLPAVLHRLDARTGRGHCGRRCHRRQDGAPFFRPGR
ncbi:MAG: hypothetical protein H5U19_09650 [Rhodobacteraceae bacterium]|nr:hypothetical protein [Paracoccaceae bacterium]